MEAKITEEVEVAGVRQDLGTRIDFVDDLGMDNDDFEGGRFYFYTTEDSWLRAEYIPFSYDSDGPIRVDAYFEDLALPIGTRVITDLDLQYLKLGWAWQPISVGDGLFKVGPLFEAKGFLVDASVEAPALPVTNNKRSEELNVALPSVGVVMDVNPLDELNIYAEVSGIPAGKYGHLYDAEAGLNFAPFDYVQITGGYRILNFRVDTGDDLARLRLAGPFLSASFRF